MTNLETLDGRRDASGGYKVDISRGERIGRGEGPRRAQPHADSRERGDPR